MGGTDGEDVLGRGRRSRSQVRFRGGCEAVPERIGHAAQGLRHRHDRSARRQLAHRSVVAVDEGLPAQRAPCRGPSATASVEPSRPSPTPTSCSAGPIPPMLPRRGAAASIPNGSRGPFSSEITAAIEVQPEPAALGVQRIASIETMAAAATRMHLAGNGRDPRKYSMIAFGGAGPVHAYNLARLLKVGTLVVLLGAGVASALGFLRGAAGHRFRAQSRRASRKRELAARRRTLRGDEGARPGSARKCRSATGLRRPQADRRHALCRSGLRDPGRTAVHVPVFGGCLAAAGSDSSRATPSISAG